MESRVPEQPGVCSFVDREEELEALDRAYRERPGLAVVYGRRRVGKTRLIWEWLKRRRVKAVYFLAHLSSHEHNLKMLAERAAGQLGDPLIAKVTPRSLGDLLTLMARSGADVVVIDEFTYWVRAAPRVASELQEFVDTQLPSTGLLVVISGSLVGVVERKILGGGSPLYARARLRLRLHPLKYRDAARMLSRMGPEDRVRVYSLVGGIPFYLCLVAGPRNAGEAVWRLVIEPGAPLRVERDLLLREELRDPHAYNAILSAIARGHTTPARIAAVTGLDPSHTHKYLAVLEALEFVSRETPLFKRKGRYRIADPILRSWYGLVEPVSELLELGLAREAFKAIMARLDEHVAPAWEELVKLHLLEAWAPEGYTLAGRLEHRGEELDVALVNTVERKAVVAEVKWSHLTLREAEALRRTAASKAYRLLPKGYTVTETYVAARSVSGGEGADWIITPANIEEGSLGTSPA